MPAAIVLSHHEQLDRLARSVPRAVPRAVVVGDPTYDRLRASLPLRRRYRRELGVTDDSVRVVVASSTWWSESLFGAWPQVLRQLMAELPVDAHRVVGVLHPHVWFAHGAYEVRGWLADCERAGLRLVDPVSGWGAALIAADVVLGDHGAVTAYAAALGRPVLLGAFPEQEVAPGSPVALLGGIAPHLDRAHSVRAQLDEAVAGFRPDTYDGVAALISSAVGEAADRLRALCYRLMGLSEPDTDPPVHRLPLRLAPVDGPTAFLVTGTVTGPASVELTRYPADVMRARPLGHPELTDTHLVVHVDHPTRSLLGNADVVFGDDPIDLADHPGCSIAVDTEVTTRDGTRLRLSGVDPVIGASALYVWGGPPPDRMVVRVAGVDYDVGVMPSRA